MFLNHIPILYLETQSPQKHEDQWNRIEDLNMNPHSYANLIFDMVPKIYDGEKTVSSTNVAGKSGYLSAKN
jgi:hypothetical protein